MLLNLFKIKTITQIDAAFGVNAFHLKKAPKKIILLRFFIAISLLIILPNFTSLNALANQKNNSLLKEDHNRISLQLNALNKQLIILEKLLANKSSQDNY